MDKRSLLYMFCLILTLFGVNFYFNQQEMERRRAWAEYQKQLAETQEKATREDLEQRQAPLTSLPITEYQADGVRHFGLWWDGTLVTLATNSPLAQSVTVLEPTGTEAEYVLQEAPVANGSVVLYRKSGAGPLTSASLLHSQTTDIQLIHFSGVDGAPDLQQGLGVWERGAFRRLTQEGKGNAIALVETADGYLPVGLFEAQEGRLIALDQIPSLEELVTAEAIAVEEQETQTDGAEYYVLENAWQQLVFSTKGATLAEINLPFVDKEHPDSIVRPIEFDTMLLEEHPENTFFPSTAYYSAPEGESTDPVLHEQGSAGGYYPLIRRAMRQKDGSVFRIQPRFQALNVVSDYPEVAELTYRVKEFTRNRIVFEASQPHRRITKTFELADSEASVPYMLTCTIRVDGDSRGLWVTSGVPEVEWISNAAAPTLKYRITRQDRSDVEVLDLPKETVSTNSMNPDWLCNSNGFFGIIMDPTTVAGAGYRAEKIAGTAVPSRLLQVDEEFERFKAKDLPGYQTLIPLPSAAGETKMRVYAGPFSDILLKQVDQHVASMSDGADPDYRSSQSFHGYFAFISRPFSKFLFVLMRGFYALTDSWGFSIILLTIALRAMTYPLNAWTMKKMKQAQQLKPLLEEIETKYKKDPQKASVEKFNLMRQYKVNPLAGCFGMLIQMPFFIGMFDLLKSTFDLRGAPFIPGWIDNLTAPDTILKWDFSIPVIGNELHVLPLLTGVMMYFQSKFTTSLPSNKAEWTDAQQQQALMGPMMAVVFAFLFYNFPSGLNLYWLSSLGLGALQQWLMNRKMDGVPLQPKQPKGGSGRGKGGKKAKLGGLA